MRIADRLTLARVVSVEEDSLDSNSRSHQLIERS